MAGFEKHVKKYYKEEYQLGGCGKCPARISAVAAGHNYDVCRKEFRLIDTDGSIPKWCPLPDGEVTYHLTCPYCKGRGRTACGFTGNVSACAACMGNGSIPKETLQTFLADDLFYKPGQWEKYLDETGLRKKGYYDNNVQALREGLMSEWPKKKHSEILAELMQGVD